MQTDIAAIEVKIHVTANKAAGVVSEALDL